MKKGLIPFYRDLSEGAQGYTLFLDKYTKQVYKCRHKDGNNLVYWVAFFLVLAFMRSVTNVYLPMNSLMNIFIVLVLIAVSIVSGISLYKFLYRDLQEIYIIESDINDYIKRYRGIFKKEVITISVVFLFALLFAVLFLLNGWLIWLIFTLFIFSMVVFGACGVPIERFKLNKKGINGI